MSLPTRHRIDAVDAKADQPLTIRWADGHESRFPPLWLLNACSCGMCGDTESAVRHVRLTDYPRRPAVSGARVTGDGSIEIGWIDNPNHVSRFDPAWLRNHCLSPKERERRRFKPTLWGADMAARLPYMSYPELRDDGDRHLAFLETLRDVGFAILRGVPPSKEETPAIAGLVGALRMTNYGIYELQSKPDPEIVADMTVALDPHTDEPYRHDPPSITFFHVLAQSEDGGASTLVDGLHAAELLRRRDPDAFDMLTRVPIGFHRTLREGRSFHMAAPVIRTERDGRVSGIRILDRGMAPLDVPPDQVEPVYDSLRAFLSILYDGEGMITVKLRSGEMLVFNNQRLLHGRTAFDPGRGTRHIRSCHVDLDEFHSKLRVMYRARGRDDAWMRLSAGAAP